MTDEEQNELELIQAEHQLLGYYYAKRGYSIESLCADMGLTLSEWTSLREDNRVAFLSKNDVRDIQDFLKNNQ